jgi:hypothetical protein
MFLVKWVLGIAVIILALFVANLIVDHTIGRLLRAGKNHDPKLTKGVVSALSALLGFPLIFIFLFFFYEMFPGLQWPDMTLDGMPPDRH